MINENGRGGGKIGGKLGGGGGLTKTRSGGGDDGELVGKSEEAGGEDKGDNRCESS